ncbi:hypothetical protein KO505_07420 [Psychrosphaera sp. F3M07]|jgi:Na+/proline symporter|uniref:Uncharacterized protein n=1 Tax=Psychrosphaera aquimarina TaxID=2044854 RepID=A0ABU3R493_9GAMM|nr:MULTISPECIES: hypothetical protein [Psychrosphaera]MBU2917790.1 hypothetical protein [Psychrosphaera sp. F3M07]MDU0114512.1 hypothetical protein [Psychrosphaera aquimarina]
MLILLIMLIVLCFSVYVAIEAMKHGMSEKSWFIAGMCFGPIIWPMFNAKRKMALLKYTERGSVRFRA